MEYLFRLPDGRRLALWSERNQIVRLVSGGGNRSQNVIRSDFLSDLSAAMHDEKIYFVYQNTASMVMLHLPDDEEDVLLFGERLESCRHSGLKLLAWNERLYLFYAAWNPVREKYALKLLTIRVSEGAESGPYPAVPENGFGRETDLIEKLNAPPEFHVLAEEDSLCVICGEVCLRLMPEENGEERWAREKRIVEDELVDLEAERSILRGDAARLEAERNELLGDVAKLEQERDELENRIEELQTNNQALIEQWKTDKTSLASAINQYNELAELTRQLQQEGKKWRDRYHQEIKKKSERTGAVRVKRLTETNREN